MKKSTWILLIIAASLLVAGLLLCVIGMMISAEGFSFEKGWIALGKSNFVTKEYEFSEAFSSVDIVATTEKLEILPASDGITRVVCQEDAREPHEVIIEDGVLKIRVEEKPWYQKINLFSWGERKMTVYLADPALDTMTLKTSTGAVRVSQEILAKNATVEFSTAKIEFAASVSEMLRVSGSTGDVSLRGAQYGNLEVKTSTGDISLSGGSAREVSLRVSTGEISVESFACGSLAVVSSTGEQEYEGVTVDGVMTLESDTGDVSIERCCAGSAKITTDTGDVEGSFSSPMIFFATTDTGKVSVPKSSSGGICEIKTDTGNIIFE